jgi:hypothetical protein
MNWQRLSAIITIIVLLTGSAYGAVKVIRDELNIHYVKKVDYQIFAMNLHLQLLDQRSSINNRELFYMRKSRQAYKVKDPTKWGTHEEERYQNLLSDQTWIKQEKSKRMKLVE